MFICEIFFDLCTTIELKRSWKCFLTEANGFVWENNFFKKYFNTSSPRVLGGSVLNEKEWQGICLS